MVGKDLFDRVMRQAAAQEAATKKKSEGGTAVAGTGHLKRRINSAKLTIHGTPWKWVAVRRTKRRSTRWMGIKRGEEVLGGVLKKSRDDVVLPLDDSDVDEYCV